MPLLAAFLFGAIVGSFLNVCIFRIPKRESIVFPGSHCFACTKPIAWYDNIPLMSYLILGGRCRNCKAAISWQYPFVEILTAGLFVLFYLKFGVSIPGVAYLIFALALLVQMFIDAKHQIIPDAITLPGILLGLILSGFIPELQGASNWQWGLVRSAIGVILGGGIFFLIGTVTEWLLKKEAMGGGDVKLLAMIGAFLGWRGVLWTIFLASLIGSIAGIYLKLIKQEERVPFGPYLAIGAVSYLFFGQNFFQWYLNVIGFGS